MPAIEAVIMTRRVYINCDLRRSKFSCKTYLSNDLILHVRETPVQED